MKGFIGVLSSETLACEKEKVQPGCRNTIYSSNWKTAFCAALLAILADLTAAMADSLIVAETSSSDDVVIEKEIAGKRFTFSQDQLIVAQSAGWFDVMLCWKFEEGVLRSRKLENCDDDDSSAVRVMFQDRNSGSIGESLSRLQNLPNEDIANLNYDSSMYTYRKSDEFPDLYEYYVEQRGGAYDFLFEQPKAFLGLKSMRIRCAQRFRDLDRTDVFRYRYACRTGYLLPPRNYIEIRFDSHTLYDFSRFLSAMNDYLASTIRGNLAESDK